MIFEGLSILVMFFLIFIAFKILFREIEKRGRITEADWKHDGIPLTPEQKEFQKKIREEAKK